MDTSLGEKNNVQLARRHLKECSPPIVREMKIKTWYYFIPVRMAFIKSLEITNVVKDVIRRDFPFMVGMNVI